MSIEEALKYIENLKWLKGYDNTTINGKTVSEILDEIGCLLKKKTEKKCCVDCEYYYSCHDET